MVQGGSHRPRDKRDVQAELKREAFMAMPEARVSRHMAKNGKPGVRIRGLSASQLQAIGVRAPDPEAGHGETDILITGAPLRKLRDVYADLAKNTDDPFLHQQLVQRMAVLGQLMAGKEK